MIKYFLSIGLVALMATFQGSNNESWLTQWEKARELSTTRQKPILLVFSGSDWCGPCIRQKAEIFHTSEFKAYAEDNLVLMSADFPRKRKNRLPEEVEEQNKKLAEQYNPEGYFPFNLLITPDGKVLGSCSYRAGGAAPFIKLLKQWQDN